MRIIAYCVLIAAQVLQLHCQSRIGGSAELLVKPCKETDFLKGLTDPRGEQMGVLRTYGYNIDRELWSCDEIESNWTGENRVLVFQSIATTSDDQSAFSVVQLRKSPYLWVIPLFDHSRECPGLENDPHNIAAFNALLRSLPTNPSRPADWSGLGKLYLALLGHKEAVAIDKNSANRNPCNSGGECTLAFADRVPRAKEPYVRWTLVFTAANGSAPVRIAYAKRDVVPGAESQVEPISQLPGVQLVHESGHADLSRRK